MIFIGSDLESNDTHRFNIHNLRLVRDFKRGGHHADIQYWHFILHWREMDRED